MGNRETARNGENPDSAQMCAADGSEKAFILVCIFQIYSFYLFDTPEEGD